MKVHWDDEIPNISGKIKNGNQTTNQYFIYSAWDDCFQSPGKIKSVPNHQPASDIYHLPGSFQTQTDVIRSVFHGLQLVDGDGQHPEKNPGRSRNPIQ